MREYVMVIFLSICKFQASSIHQFGHQTFVECFPAGASGPVSALSCPAPS